jgi:hypothetical protein
MYTVKFKVLTYNLHLPFDIPVRETFLGALVSKVLSASLKLKQFPKVGSLDETQYLFKLNLFL